MRTGLQAEEDCGNVNVGNTWHSKAYQPFLAIGHTGNQHQIPYSLHDPLANSYDYYGLKGFTLMLNTA